LPRQHLALLFSAAAATHVVKAISAETLFPKKLSTASGGIFFLALPCPGIAPLARLGKAQLAYTKGLIPNK
jgi:hypothetical protein